VKAECVVMPRLPPALHHRDFRRLWLGMLGSSFGTQMVSVAVGWQVYAIHRSAFDLGLIGLAEFLPLALLALPAGQLADRLPRTLIAASSAFAEAVVVALLLVVTLEGAAQLWAYVALAALTGAASAIGAPAGRALTPEIVPTELLAGALALRSIAGQAANVSGPALGGLLFSLQPEAVYAAGAIMLLASGALLLTVTQPERVITPGRPLFESLLEGVRFIRSARIILGAITLDLFAVLFGGAVALLPLYARSILHTGPLGLGVLRSATAVGALAGGIMLARKPLGGHAGRKLLLVVGIFGASIVVFGLSRWFPLSFAALAVSGFVDMFSMNIRQTTVALATPNELRGRVNAVEGVFLGASNELGAFESGAAAALFGAVPAVVAGGAVTIGLALVWAKVFPELARVDRLEDVAPELTPVMAEPAQPPVREKCW
jgi:MFS family permease